VIAQLYAPQATRNLAGQFWDAELALFDGDPREMAALGGPVEYIIDSNMPLNATGTEMMRRMSYNVAGKMLVVVATPSYNDYLTFQHDSEALRRMLLLKIEALKERVEPQKMPAFFVRQRGALGDPYTGEPFAWDEASKEIRFVPKSKKWSKNVLATVYAPSADAARKRTK